MSDRVIEVATGDTICIRHATGVDVECHVVYDVHEGPFLVFTYEQENDPHPSTYVELCRMRLQ